MLREKSAEVSRESKKAVFPNQCRADRDPSTFAKAQGRDFRKNYGFFPSTQSGLNDELASHFTGPSMEWIACSI